MNKILLSALLLSTAISPVLAKDMTVPSKVSEVTVYPRGAQIKRIATSEVPAGDNVIILNDLPAGLDSNSVRVSGTAGGQLEIGSVDVFQRPVYETEKAAERKKLERQIEKLGDEVSALKEKAANANRQRQILQALANRAMQPGVGSQANLTISATGLNELLTTVEQRLARLSEITEQSRIANRELNRQIIELQKKMDELAPGPVMKTIVAINLSATAKTSASFEIRYNVAQAGWRPVYDAKLKIGKKARASTLQLVRRANVFQTTTDKWENISLVLSTARPSARTQVPVLQPYIIGQIIQRPRLAKRSMEKRRTLRPMMVPAPAPEAMADAAIRVRKKRPMIRFSGFLAEYAIAGKVSVSNVGAEKNVVIDSQQYDTQVVAKAVPKRDLTAFLTAKFKVKGKSPYLPGTVLLTRDGVFLGRSHLPELKPGQEFALSFGKDDFIRVTRTKVKQKAAESGFISKSNLRDLKFVTSIKNLHDFAMKVEVIDQIPYATHADIKVTMLNDTTKPDEVNVKKKRGIVAWRRTLKAGEKLTINFGYRVEWPKSMAINLR